MVARNDIWNYVDLMNRAPYVIPALFYVIPAKAGIYPWQLKRLLYVYLSRADTRAAPTTNDYSLFTNDYLYICLLIFPVFA